MRGTPLRSSLSPVEAQRRADMWLRIGNLAMMLVVAIVAYRLRNTDPQATWFLWLAVGGVLTIMIGDYIARFLPGR